MVLVNSFWKDIINVFHPYLEWILNMNAKSVLLGYNAVKCHRLINQVINITKRYIYVTRCTETKLFKLNAINFIKRYYNTEKHVVEIYKKSKNLFHEKWLPIMLILNLS